MTETLIVVAIILLIVIQNNIKSRFNKVDSHLEDLNKKIDLLRKQIYIPEKQIGIIQKESHATQPQSTPAVSKTEEKKPVESSAVPEKTVTEPVKAPVTPAAVSAPPKAQTPKPQVVQRPVAPRKSSWEQFKEKNPDLEKFIGENLISKIGVLILVLGISYFVKFAIDKDWINEPARVGIGILCGTLIMAFAHKLRKKYSAFSSVLVAGAIAIFYFTIAIAFHDYHLFNQTTTFIIMVIITAFSALISLSYNRVELAILSLIGGFAVPFMVSTGSGNYIVLFSYITILNIGILAIACYRKWNSVNILSYIFTSILYFGWLLSVKDTENAPYANALLFAFIFYFIFILTNIINNIRAKGAFTKTELSILTTNTFLFYTAGMIILKQYHPEFKGIFTTLLALFNLLYATVLYKKFGIDKKVVYLLIGLTLTFITLAIPIQFQGNQITLFWAAEAVLLLWLAQKSKTTAFRFSSVIVHFLMLISLVIDWFQIYGSVEIITIVFNRAFTAGIAAVLSFIAVYFLIRKEKECYTQFGITFNPKLYRQYALVIAVLLLYLTGILEVYNQSYNYNSFNAVYALPALYHLVFCAIAVHFYYNATNSTSQQLTSVIAIINIVLFTFVFSTIALNELNTYLFDGVVNTIIFIAHYLSLICTVYFGFILYKINCKTVFFRHPIFTWIAAFLIIYIASTEMMLHSLMLTTQPAAEQTLLAKQIAEEYSYYDAESVSREIVYKTVSEARIQIIKIAYPILWGVISFFFLIIGIKKQWKNMRIIALSLLGLTIVKLFLYDIRNVSETGKIVAFILLGILILIISFIYQKIKGLVVSDTPKNPTNTTIDEKNN